jgi:hypothetical protein
VTRSNGPPLSGARRFSQTLPDASASTGDGHSQPGQNSGAAPLNEAAQDKQKEGLAHLFDVKPK